MLNQSKITMAPKVTTETFQAAHDFLVMHGFEHVDTTIDGQLNRIYSNGFEKRNVAKQYDGTSYEVVLL